MLKLIMPKVDVNKQSDISNDTFEHTNGAVQFGGKEKF